MIHKKVTISCFGYYSQNNLSSFNNFFNPIHQSFYQGTDVSSLRFFYDEIKFSINSISTNISSNERGSSYLVFGWSQYSHDYKL